MSSTPLQPAAAHARRLADALGEGERTVVALLALSLLLALGSVFILATAPAWPLGSGVHAGSARVLLAFVGLLLWLSLSGLFGAAWYTGVFDRLRAARPLQAGAGLAGTALLAWAATTAAHAALGSAA